MFNLFGGNSSFKNINSSEFKEKMNDEKTTIIDVRTHSEVNEGAIPNHIHIDINSPSFLAKIMDLPKDHTYLVYCRSGARSSNACNIMAKNGFSNLFNLSGGFMSWTGPVI